MFTKDYAARATSMLAAAALICAAIVVTPRAGGGGAAACTQGQAQGSANANVVPCDCRRDCPRDQTCGCCADTRVDLSGTYEGVVNIPEKGITGEATLEVTGNKFTLTTDSGVQTGTITTVVGRGFASAALSFDDAASPTDAPTVLTARVRKVGDKLRLLRSDDPQTLTFRPSARGARTARPQ